MGVGSVLGRRHGATWTNMDQHGAKRMPKTAKMVTAFKRCPLVNLIIYTSPVVHPLGVSEFFELRKQHQTATLQQYTY